MSWEAPDLPVLPGHGVVPAVVDSAKGRVQLSPGPVAGVYVCGITPYDATHLGHAATYVTFDILIRALRDAGHQVRYVQNVTDVDDPLLERAVRDGLDWRELAERETQLFREDMRALRVLPPEHYIGVVESLAVIEAQVGELVDSGAAYALPIPPADPATARSADGGADFYLDLTRRPDFGDASGWTRAQMDAVFAERGGDPDRPGKRDPLDPLLWRAARPGEPSWPSDRLGAGRPGWHIECTSIALEYLGMGFEVQGGGVDLVFPHHEMSAVQASALRGDEEPFAKAFVHQAMVGYEGHKMSKSLGNLVLVSRLRAQGVDPMAIRLVLLGHHHGTDWEYLPAMLDDATARLGLWREAVRRADPPPAAPVLAAVRAALADDLDTPGALAAIDAWALSREPGCQSSGDPSTGDPSTGRPSTGDPGVGAGSSEGHLVARLADALLGVRLDAGSD